MFFVGKEPETPKVQFDGLLGTNGRERAPDGIKLVGRRFPDEFERHMEIFRAHPARFRISSAKVPDQRGEIVSHRSGNLQRDEETHASSSLCGLRTVVQEMDAHHVQRYL